MKGVFLIVACLVVIVPARADESRIARFDVKRVFEQYQHTKDLEAVNDAKRHSRRPSEFTSVIESLEAAKERVVAARTANDRTQADTPERELSELKLQLATLVAQNLELQIALARTKREQTLREESQRERSELIGEI